MSELEQERARRLLQVAPKAVAERILRIATQGRPLTERERELALFRIECIRTLQKPGCGLEE